MTQPPDWWSQLSPGIHNAPPRVPAPDPVAFTWQQLQQIVSGLVNEFLRQVAVALGAIEIFGFKPYEALVEIGENIAAAKANFDALLAGLSVGDIGGVLGYFGNLGVTGLYNAAAGFGNLSTSLLKNLTPTGGDIGQFDASALTGAINTALTFSGTALSTLLQYLNSAGQFSAAQLTGALNGAVTFGGTALSTVLQYLNSSGQFNSAQLTGALNGAVTLGGVTLSTLVTNINSSGQLLASGITGALGTGLTVGGVTLGTLFTNINSSGQLVLSGATGALNTAVTIGGTALSTLSTNWNAAVTDISNLLTGSGLANTALVGSNLAEIGTAISNAAAGTLGSLGAIATQVQTGFSGLISGLFGGLTGIPAPATYSQAEVEEAAQAVTTNIVGSAATFVGIQNDAASSSALMSFKVTFSDYGGGSNPLGGDFTVSDDATLAPNTGGGIEVVDGRAVYEVVGSSGNAMKIARYNVAPTNTKYQEISWVHTGDFRNLAGFTGYVGIYCRMNSAATSFLRAMVGPISVDFDAVVAGTVTPNTTIGGLKPGARYTIRLGDLSDEDNIYFYENDTLLTTFADHVHQVGTSYRYAGFGLSGNNTGAAPNASHGINLFSIADQVFKPGPAAAAYVSTSQATTSATYTDLTTTTDQVTVDVGSSGMALVSVSSKLVGSLAGNSAYASFAISGATTQAATDAYAITYVPFTNGMGGNIPVSGSWVVTGLAAGSTTFKQKYRVGSGTGTFADRRISVIPL